MEKLANGKPPSGEERQVIGRRGFFVMSISLAALVFILLLASTARAQGAMRCASSGEENRNRIDQYAPGPQGPLSATVPVSLYLPLVTRAYQPPAWFSTYAASSWHLVGEGTDLTTALLAADLRWRYDHSAVTANYPPYQSRTLYHVERSLISFELGDAPQGNVLSATLELHTSMYSSIQGDFEVEFHLGQWSGEPQREDWDNYGAVLGTYATSTWQPGDLVVWVPLPGLVGQPVPESLRLTLRGDEETELTPGPVQLAAFFDLDVYDGFEYIPSSQLHLLVGGEP